MWGVPMFDRVSKALSVLVVAAFAVYKSRLEPTEDDFSLNGLTILFAMPLALIWFAELLSSNTQPYRGMRVIPSPPLLVAMAGRLFLIGEIAGMLYLERHPQRY
jgi:hypothetical protein